MKDSSKAVANDGVSRSKQKRLERQKKNASKKAESAVAKVIGAVVIVAIVAIIVVGIGSAVYKAATTLSPSSDFSAELDDNGYIKGVKATDYINLADYKNIEIPRSEVEYSDEDVEKDIQSALSSHQVLKEDADIEIASGDKVNIDYVGTIDGVEFEGGNSNGNGSDLTIGSGQFITGFEDQLIGHKPGEEVIVNVTFPEDYSTADLAGKDAQFDVIIHGVYADRDFDDDFVCAYYSDYATTADGYREYLKDTNMQDNITEYVENYLYDNSSIIKYPSKYLKNVKETTMYSDQQSYEYMNQMYMQYNGQGVGTFQDYTGKTDEEYKASVAEDSEETVKKNLIYQAILENEGIKLDQQYLHDHLVGEDGDETSYNNALEQYGLGYRLQTENAERAIEIAKSYVVLK